MKGIKILTVGGLILLMGVNGCAALPEGNLTESQMMGMEISEMEVINIRDILEQTVRIKVTDPCVKMYNEELNAELGQELLTALKNMAETMSISSDENAGSKTFYMLELYDQENVLLASWKVDTQHRILPEKNQIIKPDTELKKWFKQMEKQLGISYAVFERAPGADFLKLTEEAACGSLTEITENNFQQGIKYDLAEADLEELKNNWPDITFSDTKTELQKVCIQIHIYTEEGAELYCFAADDDGNLYTDNGYLMLGEFPAEWLEMLKAKAGYEMKEK